MSSRYRELSASSLLRPSPFFLVDFIVFTFQGTSFSPRRRPVRSFFLFQYGDLLLTFLFSRNNTLPSPRRASMHHRSLSLSRFLESNNRHRHSFFFFSSSMNLCLQQLCKKKGGQGKKKKGKEYRVFPRTKPGLSQPDAPDTISLFIFLLLLLDEKEFSFETFQPVDISRSTNGRRAPFGFFIPFAG